jgi:hypothetical protein
VLEHTTNMRHQEGNSSRHAVPLPPNVPDHSGRLSFGDPRPGGRPTVHPRRAPRVGCCRARIPIVHGPGGLRAPLPPPARVSIRCVATTGSLFRGGPVVRYRPRSCRHHRYGVRPPPSTSGRRPAARRPSAAAAVWCPACRALPPAERHGSTCPPLKPCRPGASRECDMSLLCPLCG